MPTRQSRLNEIVIGFIKYSIHNNRKKWAKVIKRIKAKRTQTQCSTGWARKRSPFDVCCLLILSLFFCVYHFAIRKCIQILFELHSIRFGFVSQSVSISSHPINFHSKSHGFWLGFVFMQFNVFTYDELFPAIQELHEAILVYVCGHRAYAKQQQQPQQQYHCVALVFEAHSRKINSSTRYKTGSDNDSAMVCYCCCVYGFVFAIVLEQHPLAPCVRASVSSTSVYILSTWFTFRQQQRRRQRQSTSNYIEPIHCTLSIRHDEWTNEHYIGLADLLVADSGWLMDTHFQLSEMFCVFQLEMSVGSALVWAGCICLCELNYLCA